MKNNLVNLSIEQLKSKLVDCESGSFKEFILKKIINKKINREKQIKIELNKKKLIKLKNIKRKQEEINLVNSILKDQECSSDNENDELSLDFEEEIVNQNKNLNELDGQDFKFKKEVAKDHLNNNLTARMNSDIDIKKIQKKRKESKKNFVKPFEDASSNYDKFFDKVIPNNDFSNDRLM
ncbi:MAG: hypothetical protein CMF62_01580 [Magnetococcales bacterium]|nr:hypothetical protein [Magnetococcales bacterium]|tara:strand:+ start:46041 stop:46580 length:540 start_codon:yes stop_codon:yes gene_type:complete